jgi:DNA-binding response OmpR family regulator
MRPEVFIMNDILLIEDDANIRFFLEEELSLEGYTVSSAADGAQGLAAAESHRPDVVLLDLMMPGIPGEEVLRILKAKDPKLPVVIYTAYSDRRDLAENLGADAVLVKSADCTELLSVIGRFCHPSA